jgi:UDP-2-acetamido-3-amino-2,3-dideoxy-glucuronate N-acetyltransferase
MKPLLLLGIQSGIFLQSINQVEDYYIHPTAVLDPGATIGSGSRIWHFSHIMPGSCMGENCVIGQNVFIANDVELGNGVKVQNNVSLYKGLICEDSVFIGPSVVFTNVINPRSHIERKNEFKKTLVRKGATIGANATVLCGIEIGAFAFVGAGAVVTRSVPDYGLVIGNPARLKGWMSTSGSRLEFDETGTAICPDSGEKYALKNNKVTRIV